MIEVGAEAPDFELPDEKGKLRSLAEYRGRRLLIAFYPLDFSPVCSDQLAAYEDIAPQLEEAGVELVGVSVDSAFAHSAFKEKLGIGNTLLADFEPKGEVARRYGAYLEDWGHSNRSLVMVGPDGLVEWVHESETPAEFPAPDLILRAL